ncbi:hypothetical protein LNAOJCKE_0977 [Methylorubrum aminovorans]|uniref:Uncharacterized protein n=1 Tax=Methylorubrum aminovorans TaxID=269069 RepID=A0ABQ4U8P5_9HYPH|nr:hypothetical protein [Methylorubrum aminovorans]GJE63779.1 hypothetical protein LNAOJCKE_0977 [Methylorubrum aminovorans]GMA73619.1 hypothetical protein GCM10025880_00360 [Methylorubrum aminovorans]GMA73707.1 hypothetical protein GCM10025880_01240 [Methylorubrum aminovorans]
MGEKTGTAANLACVDKLLREMFEEHHEKMEGFRHKGDYLMAQYHAGHSQAYGVAAGIIHGIFNPAAAAQELAAQDPALSREGDGR